MQILSAPLEEKLRQILFEHLIIFITAIYVFLSRLNKFLSLQRIPIKANETLLSHREENEGIGKRETLSADSIHGQSYFFDEFS